MAQPKDSAKPKMAEARQQRTKAMHRAWVAANPDKIREYHQRYARKHAKEIALHEATPERIAQKARYAIEHKEAINQYRKTWAANNSDKRKATYRRYRALHADVIKLRRREYYQRHRSEFIRGSIAWRNAHPERFAKTRAAYLARPDVKSYIADKYQRNKELYDTRKKAWREANRERDRENARIAAAIWRSANRELLRSYSSKYRASKLSALGTHTAADIVRLYEFQHGQCQYCNIELGASYAIDHWWPLSKGGTNYCDNLQLLCKSCNSRKHNRNPYEYEVAIGYLDKLPDNHTKQPDIKTRPLRPRTTH